MIAAYVQVHLSFRVLNQSGLCKEESVTLGASVSADSAAC